MSFGEREAVKHRDWTNNKPNSQLMRLQYVTQTGILTRNNSKIPLHKDCEFLIYAIIKFMTFNG